MAKLKFADANCCKQAWLGAKNIVWPQGAVPRVDELPHDIKCVDLQEEVDVSARKKHLPIVVD